MDEELDVKEVIEALGKSWSAETAYDTNDWSPENPARGQCAVSSLIMQDFFGGEIIRFVAEFDGRREKHYANIINETTIDTTMSQFPADAVLVADSPDLVGFSSLRQRMLSDENTELRYEILKHKVSLKIDDSPEE